MTKIASITVTSKRHKIIGDALESVRDQVDAFVFVSLGIDSKTEDVILDRTGLKPCHFIECSPKLQMADWRNAGISFSQELGFDWAIQLDTDERMIFGDTDLHECLSSVEGVDTLSVLRKSGSYSKERFFRLPTTHKFHGNIHEYWDGDKVGLLQGIYFDEIPKTEETINKNIPKQIRGLKRQQREEPNNHRWPFYLAVFNRAIGNYPEAIYWADKCTRMYAPAEAKAWDCYIASMCSIESGNHADGMLWACKGLQFHPGLAELSFVAGVCCMKMGRPQEALCWANMALANSLTSGSSFAANRMGFREPYMLWEGPFQMQADAMKAMGYPEEKIKESLEQAEEAKKWRENARNNRIASPEVDI